MISCSNITKSFGELRALSNITFDVKAGRICALLGPNGAGKSTLVKILTGLLRPTHGSATVAGYNTRDGGPPLKRCIGVVPEGLALFDDLTIEEHLHMSGPIYGLNRQTTRERASQLLRMLALEDGRRRFMRDCSHGMRKKTALALALLHSPPVLILDE
ncbi:MAG: ABC transporter ATP-binding protein, partial [Bryobacteraceae bacterium]